jgi:hypothetical protein
MASYDKIYMPSFIKIGAGVQAIIKFCPTNLRGYNISTIDGRDL